MYHLMDQWQEQSANVGGSENDKINLVVTIFIFNSLLGNKLGQTESVSR